MADDEDGGDAAQVESEPQAAGGVVSNPILMTRTKSSVELQDLADVEEGEYVVGWKTIRGMIALHVSLSTDMVRMYNMQMNRAQKVVAFTLAFVYGMGQVCAWPVASLLFTTMPIFYKWIGVTANLR